MLIQYLLFAACGLLMVMALAVWAHVTEEGARLFRTVLRVGMLLGLLLVSAMAIIDLVLSLAPKDAMQRRLPQYGFVLGVWAVMEVSLLAAGWLVPAVRGRAERIRRSRRAPGSAEAWKRGVIMADSGDVIARPGMTLDELRRTAPGRVADVVCEGRHCRATMVPVQVEGTDWAVTAFFTDEVVTKVLLEPHPPEAQRMFANDSPADPARRRWLEQFVERATGGASAAEYEWGRIAAVQTEEGGFSGVEVRYAEGGRPPGWSV